MIRIEVEGIPAPKGSFRISSRGRGREPIVRKDSPATEAWEKLVGWAARMAMRGHDSYADRALAVYVEFRLPRPQRHVGSRGLLPSAPRAPSVKPDLDKLLRSTFDAMQGIVFDEDSRIVEVQARKRYAVDVEAPGASIRVAVFAAEAA